MRKLDESDKFDDDYYERNGLLSEKLISSGNEISAYQRNVFSPTADSLMNGCCELKKPTDFTIAAILGNGAEKSQPLRPDFQDQIERSCVTRQDINVPVKATNAIFSDNFAGHHMLNSGNREGAMHYPLHNGFRSTRHVQFEVNSHYIFTNTTHSVRPNFPYQLHHQRTDDSYMVNPALQQANDHHLLHTLRSSGRQKTTDRTTKSKRTRTVFTPKQLEKLEAAFSKHRYMIGEQRAQLAKQLNLGDAQVKIWFQNRRIKWRNQKTKRRTTPNFVPN